MNTDRKTATMVGVFFIAATVAGIVSAVLSGPIQAQDYLTAISENENQVIFGALAALVMAIAVAGIAITAYPVLRRHNEALALGYVGARIVEGVLFIATVISWLLLVVLSRQYVGSGAADSSFYAALGGTLLAVGNWVGHVVLDVAVSPIHYLIFYSLLYRSRLVPRWLSLWGFAGVPLWLAAGFLAMFGSDPTSTPLVILNIPIALNEMVLAVWLIVKGFNTSATDTVQARPEASSI
ncbi:MAG: DUF4386 domain-containing protein [Spirochaetaceae bacterium]|nr:DUF4386 domain-containing protein [Spirochaetaceae bacterium]